jgi:hypothetical protein
MDELSLWTRCGGVDTPSMDIVQLSCTFPAFLSLKKISAFLRFDNLKRGLKNAQQADLHLL